MEKNDRTGQTDRRRQYDTAHVLCVLDTNTTNTRSEYVILVAFPRQQWLREPSLNVTFIRSSLVLSEPFAINTNPYPANVENMVSS